MNGTPQIGGPPLQGPGPPPQMRPPSATGPVMSKLPPGSMPNQPNTNMPPLPPQQHHYPPQPQQQHPQQQQQQQQQQQPGMMQSPYSPTSLPGPPLQNGPSPLIGHQQKPQAMMQPPNPGYYKPGELPGNHWNSNIQNQSPGPGPQLENQMQKMNISGPPMPGGLSLVNGSPQGHPVGGPPGGPPVGGPPLQGTQLNYGPPGQMRPPPPAGAGPPRQQAGMPPQPPSQQQHYQQQQQQPGMMQSPYSPTSDPYRQDNYPQAGMNQGYPPPHPGYPPMSQPQTGYNPNYSSPASPPYQQQQHQQASQRRLDPDQLPSPIQVMQDDQRNHSGFFYTNQKGQMPPLVTTNFITVDQGNCSPRFIRSTMYNVPVTVDMMKQTAVPFALVISPLARVAEGEQSPPVVNMGEIGPVRCIRCKAYMSPFMQFTDGGRRFHCLYCKAVTEVPG